MNELNELELEMVCGGKESVISKRRRASTAGSSIAQQSTTAVGFSQPVGGWREWASNSTGSTTEDAPAACAGVNRKGWHS